MRSPLEAGAEAADAEATETGAAGLGAGTGVGAGAGGAAVGAFAGAGACDFAGADAGAGADAAAAEPAASITPTTVWIGTVWPSATLISLSTPAEGEGISASTLSVEISNNGSSRSTLSPGFLSHLVMVPSKMLSPIWGITTSTAMTCSPSAAGRLRDLWEPETPGFSLRNSAQPYQSTAKSTVTETRSGLR